MVGSHTLELALFSAGILGFRHGFDYDHIAAISDITSVESAPPKAMRMGLVYVVGHAATVALLGAIVIFFQRSLPARIDGLAERAVGLTLVLLGIYVFGTLLRDKAHFRPRSRASLLIGAAHWLSGKVCDAFGEPSHRSQHRDLPDEKYSPASVFCVGVIHGLGAETPSQLLLFFLAANLGGVARGFLGLSVFLTGLLAMNTLMTASAVGIFGAFTRKPHIMRFVVALSATYSVVVGMVFLFGSSAILPSIN